MAVSTFPQTVTSLCITVIVIVTASKIPSESKIGKMNIGQEEATSHTAGGVNDKDKQ